MTTSERVRCPCCGEVFALADALPVDEPPTSVPPPTPVAANAPALPAGSTSIPITLVFDGGSIGNPGRGYGSYQLTVRGKAEPVKRLEFDGNYTNNEAEYDTLIGALETLLRRVKEPQRVQLDIRGDSQLIINQITGAWKTKDARMQERRERVLAALAHFGSWTATWHPRAKSVKALGH
jgi:ribonuclease HI